MKSTHPLYGEVLEQYQKLWDKDTKMVDYCIKKDQDAVRLSDGSIVTFEKPGISTKFCFGWFNGDMESYDEANKCASGLGRKKAYFMSQNLSSLERQIENIKDKKTNMYVYDAYRPWMTLKNYVLLTFTDDLWKFNNAKRAVDEEADRKAILEALEKIKSDFTKRLETWWKRYGADHIRTWTYCCDD